MQERADKLANPQLSLINQHVVLARASPRRSHHQLGHVVLLCGGSGPPVRCLVEEPLPQELQYMSDLASHSSPPLDTQVGSHVNQAADNLASLNEQLSRQYFGKPAPRMLRLLLDSS